MLHNPLSAYDGRFMLTLRTVILHHVTRQGSHYDWLMEDPHTQGVPNTPLWTARVDLPPAQWGTRSRLQITPLAPHRHAYLQYQGPISNQRGSVKRIAQGTFTASLWTPARRIMQIQWQQHNSSTTGDTIRHTQAMHVEICLAHQSNWLTIRHDDASGVHVTG